MPGKGKILMGKGPVKRPTPVKPKPKAMPMPKANPGKPAPKGGKVIDRKIQDNKNIKGGPLSLAELRKRIRIPVDTISNSEVKRKPVMPPRRGR